jgi:hypothetical protein
MSAPSFACAEACEGAMLSETGAATAAAAIAKASEPTFLRGEAPPQILTILSTSSQESRVRNARLPRWFIPGVA